MHREAKNLQRSPAIQDGSVVPVPVPVSASATRAFYTFGIDLSDFDSVSQESVSRLQEIRSNGGLGAVFAKRLNGVPGFIPQARVLREDSRAAVGLGGKKVWSETFLEDRASWVLPRPDEFRIDREDVRVGATLRSVHDDLRGWRLDSVRQYVTPDGVLVGTCSFRTDDAQPIHRLVTDLRRFEQYGRSIFEQSVAMVLEDESRFRTMLKGIGFVAGTEPKSERIRVHRTTFVQSLLDEAGQACAPHSVRSTHAIAGLMNLAAWYREYHSQYLKHLGKKEFGYKDTELFLTDRRASLAVQRDFWDLDNPLHFYMGDVLLAVEYHVGIQALLKGQLQYARALYSASRRGAESGRSAVEGVRQSRAILSGAYESLNYAGLVLHGFTRLFLSQLDRESEIETLLTDVERRVQNVTDAVALHASVESSGHSHNLQVLGNAINRRVLVVTIAGASMAALSLIVTLITLLTRAS